MARARLLKPGFFANEELAELPALARLLFAGLWTLADREGRMEDRPKRIQGAIFPYEDVSIEPLLVMLAAAGFILRYIVAGERYLQVVSFTKHQKIHPREALSELPGPEATPRFALGTPSLALGTPRCSEAEAVTEAEAEAEAVSDASSEATAKPPRSRKPDYCEADLDVLRAEHPTVDITELEAYWRNDRRFAFQRDKLLFLGRKATEREQQAAERRDGNGRNGNNGYRGNGGHARTEPGRDAWADPLAALRGAPPG